MAGERITTWAKAVRARKRRAPRVLHVGNIANNAYLNARSLAPFGVESHVLCNDLYHVNSNPEWFDSGGANMDRAALGDDFFPNFWAAGIDDRVRPRWFAQGSLFTALHYLQLTCQRSPLADLAWDALDYERFRAVCARTAAPQNIHLDDAAFAEAAAASRLPDHTRARFARVRAYQPALNRLIDAIATTQGRAATAKLSLPMPIGYVDTVARAGGDPSAFAGWRKLRAQGITAALGWELSEIGDWRAPPRPWEIAEQDILPYLPLLGHWDGLFAHYDQLILYATQPLLGALTQRRYLAYEHGTIRSIPFDDSAIGRLTKASYQRAAGVFITNIDYIVARPRLEFAKSRIHYIPHAFDEAPLLNFRAAHPHLQPDRHVVTFFWPTRQDWRSRDLRMCKHNDYAIHAVALARARTDKPFRVVAIDWGVDSDASRALIAELGIGDLFEWIGMLDKTSLWAWYLRAHAVIDQFAVSTVNGVTSESLMLGRPTICVDDGVCVAQAYGERAPYLSAANAEEIAARLIQVINDPQDRAGVGAASQAWALRRHSAAAICDILADGFKKAPNARLRALLREHFRDWSEALREKLSDVFKDVSRFDVLNDADHHRRRQSAPAYHSPGVDTLTWNAIFRTAFSPRLWLGRGRQFVRPILRALRLAPRTSVAHFNAAAEDLAKARAPAAADLDWRAALTAGYRASVVFDAACPAVAHLGAIRPDHEYVVYWRPWSAAWVGIGPNGELLSPDGAMVTTAAICPDTDGPVHASFTIWGARFTFTPDGAVYHLGERVGQLS